MSSFLDRVRSGEVLVADGAMGTLLFEEGLEPGQCPERMNLERPDILESIARRYLDAGAEILHTNTFGASAVKLADYGLAEQYQEINRAAVAAARSALAAHRLAQETVAQGEETTDAAVAAARSAVGSAAASATESASRDVYVSCSCGPSGRILEPYGDTAETVLYEGFEQQLGAIVAAGVDLITIETMTDLREAVLAVRATRSISPDIPVLATMTFDDTPRGFYTVMGVSVEQAAEGLLEAGADLIGSNCGNGIETMVRIACAFAEATDQPIVIQSNAGLPEVRDGKVYFPESPAFFGEKTPALLEAGVSVMGGCCGTTPDYIRAIRRVVDERKP